MVISALSAFMKPSSSPKVTIPSLAGIAPLTEAMKPGLSVEECVRRLNRYHYAFKRLHQIFTARITAEPLYELKMAFSLHAHLCAEHATALRKRVGEMREPPLGARRGYRIRTSNCSSMKFWPRHRRKNLCSAFTRKPCPRSSRP